MTVQPTEQCVQMFLRMVTCAPAGGGGPACALRTLPSWQRAERGEAAGDEAGAAQEGAAVEGAVGLARHAPAESAPRRAWRSVLLISTARLLFSSDSG